MSTIYRNFIITFLISTVIGCGATLIIVNSDNGYVAGFVFLPLFLLIGVATLILFVTGLVCLGLESKSAPWILLAAVLLPVSFFSSAMIAKHFEIGAYYQEPMISLSDNANNVVLFKEGTTRDQINDFWEKTMSLERGDGRGYDHLPGIRTMMQIQPRNGREAMAFGFSSNATEEQKQFVFSKVKSSPIVYKLLENESLKEQNDNDSSSNTEKTGKSQKFKVENLTNSK